MINKSPFILNFRAFGSNAKQLKAALDALPELTMNKSIIDMHTKIALSVLESIKARHLDSLFSDEENLPKMVKNG